MRALLILKGDVFLPEKPYDLTICCDGAYDLVEKTKVDLIVGDMDSILQIPHGVELVRVPTEKDFTDGELGLREAIKRGATEIDVAGAFGGRIDHALTNLFLLPIGASLGARVKLIDRVQTCMLGFGHFCLEQPTGSTVSLVPVFGSVHILKTKGLKYAANNLTLTPSETIGVSNEMIADSAIIEFGEGQCLVVI